MYISLCMHDHTWQRMFQAVLIGLLLLVQDFSSSGQASGCPAGFHMAHQLLQTLTSALCLLSVNVALRHAVAATSFGHPHSTLTHHHRHVPAIHHQPWEGLQRQSRSVLASTATSGNSSYHNASANPDARVMFPPPVPTGIEKDPVAVNPSDIARLVDSGFSPVVCGTRSHLPDSKARVQQLITTVATNATFVPPTINVYFHIMRSIFGIGDVTQTVLDAQVASLNKQYNRHGFTFKFAGVTRTINDLWFNGLSYVNPEQLDYREYFMKSSLRKGTMADLNIYTATLANRIGGWAYFPDIKQMVYDGVTVDYRSLAGQGGLGPEYMLGFIPVHEVS